METTNEAQLACLKKTTQYARHCPICGEKQIFGIELGVLKKIEEFPYPHIFLHGTPLHAMIVYIDANFKVRGIEGCQSIEVLRDSTTLGQIIAKWSNPF